MNFLFQMISWFMICIALIGKSYAQKVYKEQPQHLNYKIIVGAEFGLVKPENMNEFQSAGIAGVNIGVVTERELQEFTSLWFGLTYNLLNMQDYRNTITYYSYWGMPNNTIPLKHSDDVRLQTQIKQQSFEVPIILKYHYNKVSIGGGAILSCLVSTFFKQNVEGHYEAPQQFSNSSPSYNESIRFVLNKTNYNSSPFPKYNISPAINLGYSINRVLNVEFISSYSLLKAQLT